MAWQQFLIKTPRPDFQSNQQFIDKAPANHSQIIDCKIKKLKFIT